MPLAPRPTFRRLMPGLALAVALAAGGCVGNAPYDDLASAHPTGSPFSRALFKNYAYLARSYGIASSPSTTAFDASGSISVAGLDNDVADIANIFAEKALTAAKGQEPLPEPAPTDDQSAEQRRLRLLRALDQGRTKAPRLAARAQADYDCWVLNGTVSALRSASVQCLRAFNADLSRLGGQSSYTAPPPKPAPKKQTTVDFTALFALNSSTLTPEAMAVLRRVIETARAGRQSRITIVGHTDTTGTEPYNLVLSKARAAAVRQALISMGARPAAIQVTGIGEKNLAVQTPEGVAEKKNRRAVITLVP